MKKYFLILLVISYLSFVFTKCPPVNRGRLTEINTSVYHLASGFGPILNKNLLKQGLDSVIHGWWPSEAGSSTEKLDYAETCEFINAQNLTALNFYSIQSILAGKANKIANCSQHHEYVKHGSRFNHSITEWFDGINSCNQTVFNSFPWDGIPHICAFNWRTGVNCVIAVTDRPVYPTTIGCVPGFEYGRCVQRERLDGRIIHDVGHLFL